MMEKVTSLTSGAIKEERECGKSFIVQAGRLDKVAFHSILMGAQLSGKCWKTKAESLTSLTHASI
ncbi:MAG: hypothetical protein KAJ95_09575 [Gammaproteobacteria bacterium]|nr:hypothetical protein [Gammaproteobacteria bacterium]